MIAAPQNYLSTADYWQWEEQQEEKHEYVNGMIYAMADATENHIDITTNLTVILSNHLMQFIKMLPYQKQIRKPTLKQTRRNK